MHFWAAPGRKQTFLLLLLSRSWLSSAQLSSARLGSARLEAAELGPAQCKATPFNELQRSIAAARRPEERASQAAGRPG